MSWQGLEGLPEQGTDVTEAIPHTINKWAKDIARQDKAEVGWPHWAPPPQPYHMEAHHWITRSVHRGIVAEEASLGRDSLL